MNEATLKTKWRRHAAKHGVWTRSMSPHQIPGCPDIVAMDCGASEIVRELRRARLHWIEAKVANIGPVAFRAERDATSQQILWVRELDLLGGSTWWLVLAPKTWLLVAGSRDQVSREEFRRKGRRYGAAPDVLFEPESERKLHLKDSAERLQTLRLGVSRSMGRKKR